jgi:hypothetical protein
MHFPFDDDREFEVKMGEVFDVPTGHDAGVVGNHRCTFVPRADSS